jgi:hypothetical protein
MVLEQQQKERKGMSYIVSGTLELLGGVFAESTTTDPVAKGVYLLFESIGIASIGYGAYTYKVQSDEDLMRESLHASPFLSDKAKVETLRKYFELSKVNSKKEDRIKALTHGLIALLNFYSGSRQKSEPVRNTIFFIGGVNLLACISYSF